MDFERKTCTSCKNFVAKTAIRVVKPQEIKRKGKNEMIPITDTCFFALNSKENKIFDPIKGWLHYDAKVQDIKEYCYDNNKDGMCSTHSDYYSCSIPSSGNIDV